MKMSLITIVAASLFLLFSSIHGVVSSLVHDDDIQLFIYETETEEDSPSRNLIRQAQVLEGVTATLFGQGQDFEGFGSKFTAVKPLLESLPSDSLVVLSDGRDVLINNPNDSTEGAEAVRHFRDSFEAITSRYPGSIVISAEAQCCVSALTYLQPGDLFNDAGERQQRACNSGEAGCLWNGDDKTLPWEKFMKDVAIDRMGASATDGDEALDDVYLNAGLISGKASDLLRVIEAADIGTTEDDQAVLTDFMYKNPDQIVLDYGQKMFGNNRGGVGGLDSCIFELSSNDQLENSPTTSHRLVHSKTRTSPLFVHSPGGYLQCHDHLAAQLGLEAVSPRARRRLGDDHPWNYGCPSGKKLDGSGYCVEDWCHDNFQCPTNSHRIANRQCYNNEYDCTCDFGCHRDVRNNCVRDVTCRSGWKLDGSGYCVKKWCNFNYQCPSGMKRKPNRFCYNKKNDCQ